MVPTTVGKLEWGAASMSGSKTDPKLDRLFNQIVPPIIEHENGTRSLDLGLRLDQGEPILGWETASYNHQGFEGATVAWEDDEEYREIAEQDLRLPEPLRHALGQLVAELDCKTSYTLHGLHVTITIVEYERPINNQEEFLTMLADRLDYWMAHRTLANP